MVDINCKHLKEINETWGEHWISTMKYGFTLLGLLSLVNYEFSINEGSYNINLAGVLFVIAIIFYSRLSLSITIGMFLSTGLCISYINKLENAFDQPILIKYYLIVFIVAWIGQFIGHKIEGEKPSFLKDIQFLLIGPAWLLSFIYKKLNIPI